MRSLLTFRAATNERNEFGDGVSAGRGGRANIRKQGVSEKRRGGRDDTSHCAYEVHDVMSCKMYRERELGIIIILDNLAF